MGWLLWGVLIGWAACATYHYSQNSNEKSAQDAAAGSVIIFILIGLLAITISVNLGVESGAIKNAPTPTLQGR